MPSPIIWFLKIMLQNIYEKNIRNNITKTIWRLPKSQRFSRLMQLFSKRNKASWGPYPFPQNSNYSKLVLHTPMSLMFSTLGSSIGMITCWEYSSACFSCSALFLRAHLVRPHGALLLNGWELKSLTSMGWGLFPGFFHCYEEHCKSYPQSLW